MRKKEDKTRKHLGNPGDIVKVSGIVQHLGKIGDKQTIEIKVQEMVASNPELKELFEEYIARKSKNS